MAGWDTPPTPEEMGVSDWDAPPTESELRGATKEKPGKLKSLVGGAFQGVSLGFGDEFAGGIGRLLLGKGVKLGRAAQPAADDSPELRAAKTRAIEQQDAAPTSYEITRDLVRGGLREAQETNPKTFLAGEVLGGAALPVPGGVAAQGATRGAKLLRAVGQGAAMGGAYGLGSSEGRVNRGEFGTAAADTALGVGLGAAGGALAEGVAAPLFEAGGKLVAKGADALRKRAGRGVSEAAERARSMALKEGTEEIGSLTGTLGGETQKGSRMTENIRRIPGEAAQATPESQAALMRDAARIARERADDMLNQAKAQGLEDVPDKVGEFLTKGSKLDKAQRSRSQAQRLLDGAKQMEEDAARVLRGEIAPDALNANLQKARDIALESAPFKKLEGTVLSENIRQLPEQVAKIEAARAARDAAAKGLDTNVAKRAEDILSGRAATQRLKELALRYALPGAGAAAGWALGDEYGALGSAGAALAGYKLGGGANAAVGALAGAGLRPGLQALYRTATQYPAVSKLLWRGVGGAADAGDLVRLGAPGLSGLLPPAASRSEAVTAKSRALADALRRGLLGDSGAGKDEGLAGY